MVFCAAVGCCSESGICSEYVVVSTVYLVIKHSEQNGYRN